MNETASTSQEPDPLEPTRGDTPAYQRLSRATEGLILKLSDEGKTQHQVAQMVGCSQATVSRTLAAFQDTRALAKSHLHNNAIRLAERVIKQANVEESLEVLDRLDVAPKKERGGNSHTGVQVIVNMPGQSSSKPPVIDLSPVAHQQLAQESTG